MYIMLCSELLCLESVALMPARMRDAITNKVGRAGHTEHPRPVCLFCTGTLGLTFLFFISAFL